MTSGSLARLALVCYGGVSLAIYMHGITKELEKLTRASAQLIKTPAANPYPQDKSEHAYSTRCSARRSGTVIARAS
jgi:hypothetical protein